MPTDSEIEPPKLTPEKVAIMVEHLKISATECARALAKAYAAGERARTCKYSRTSTYYNDPLADEFFYAGYDGLPWESVSRRLFPFEVVEQPDPEKLS
jgi:hypothetical protein